MLVLKPEEFVWIGPGLDLDWIGFDIYVRIFLLLDVLPRLLRFAIANPLPLHQGFTLDTTYSAPRFSHVNNLFPRISRQGQQIIPTTVGFGGRDSNTPNWSLQDFDRFCTKNKGCGNREVIDLAPKIIESLLDDFFEDFIH